ncbi:MAG TPA: hypothetical protein PLS49_06460 [Candidatus Woesebacteria bacterium]|nr:hypothetical protein [Candidatus Woesebacteria bacterium]
MRKYLKIVIIGLVFIITIELFWMLYRSYYFKPKYTTLPSSEQNSENNNILYSTNNNLLFNNTRGNNYVVGLFQTLTPINDSKDELIVLKEPSSDNYYKFRIVFEATEIDGKNVPLTIMGEEHVEKVNDAKEREDIIEYISIINGHPDIDLNKNFTFINNIKQNDLIVVNFVGCDIDNNKQCIRDSSANIYVLGLYRRISEK